MYTQFNIEKKDQVVIVTMLRDTMAPVFANELYEVMRQLDQEEETRVILLKNDGRFFCAGGDLSGGKPMSPYEFKLFITNVNRAIRQIRETKKPVIALVNGAAAGGGCNLAISCDLVLASEKALFREVFVNVNTVPDTGGLWSLMRLVGTQKAKELCMTGRKVYAEEALQLGMITQMVPSEQLMDVGMSLAVELAKKPPAALAAIKQLCDRMPELTYSAYCDLECNTMAVLKSMDDSQEGKRAFMEKREPAFTGH